MPTPHDPAVAEPGDDAARALGESIRLEREAAGQSIEEVAAATRLRGSLLRSMESGDFAPCGGHVYARGHLRAIALTVGVAPATFLHQYDRLAGTPPAPKPMPVSGAAASSAPPTVDADPLAIRDLSQRTARKPASMWLLAAVGAAFVIAIVAGASLLRSGGDGGPTTARSGAPPTTSTPAPSSSTGPPPTSPPETLALAGVNVVVRVHDSPSWVHVTDESGAVLFQGTVDAGQSKPFHSAQRLRFVFGFAPAIDLTVNGRPVGAPPAGAGQVSTVSFDATDAAATTG